MAQNLYFIPSRGGPSDGAAPFGGLIADSSGNFYGTTVRGGISGCNHRGCGTIFELTPDGTETVLHSFDSLPRGLFPESALIMDANGNLFGTTVQGGEPCKAKFNGKKGCGTVFELTP